MLGYHLLSFLNDIQVNIFQAISQITMLLENYFPIIT